MAAYSRLEKKEEALIQRLQSERFQLKISVLSALVSPLSLSFRQPFINLIEWDLSPVTLVTMKME